MDIGENPDRGGQQHLLRNDDAVGPRHPGSRAALTRKTDRTSAGRSAAAPRSGQASSLDISATIVKFTAEMRTMPAAIM
jgi:hypothetical protein